MYLTIIDVCNLSKLDANLAQFMQAHPLLCDFWETCSRADWMRDVIAQIYNTSDISIREQLFHKRNKEYWQLARLIAQQNNLRIANDNEKAAILQQDLSEINAFQRELEQAVANGTITAPQANFSSWLAADDCVIHHIRESISDNKRRSISIAKSIMHIEKEQALGRELSREEKAENDMTIEKIKKQKELQILKEQAQAFRDILGNPFLITN